MLEALDKVKWHKLEHAYGPANDVPDLIRALATGDAEARKHAHYALYGNLYHQGTVYQATSYAVPFFLELLQHDSVPDKQWILVYLAHLASGSSYLDVHVNVEDEREQVKAKLEQELADVKRVYDTVMAGVPLYMRLLEHRDSALRVSAAYLLACFPDRAKAITLKLLHRLRVKEKEPRVKAALILSLGAYARPKSTYLQLFESIMRTDSNALVRLASAMTLVRVARARTPRSAIDVLLAAMKESRAISADYILLPWASDTDLVADICGYLSYVGHSAAQTALPAMVEVLPRLDDYSALSVASTLLYIAFKGQSAPEGVKGRTLTPEQRIALRAIAGCDNAWTYGNMAFLLQDYGLPTDREKLRKFLR